MPFPRFLQRLLTVIVLLPAFCAYAGASEVVLHTFAGGTSDGANPAGGLIADGAANMYGTTPAGGTFGAGTVYMLPSVTGTTDIVLYDFTGGTDGGTPLSTLVMDASGNLWGTTEHGGNLSAPCTGGCGVVFELSPVGGGAYAETVVYTFSGLTDGGLPTAGLTLDSSGNFYGTASCGGSSSCTSSGGYGVVFEISSGAFSVLHTFTGTADGAAPVAPVTINGTVLYGTTKFGGGAGTCSSTGCGVAFALSLATGSISVLHPFSGGADGGKPLGAVVLNPATSILYGTASCGGLTTNCAAGTSGSGNGVVFKVGATGTSFGILHSFNGANGANPAAGMVFNNAKSLLYGTTEFGGVTTGSCAPAGCGVVFKMKLTGTEAVLYKFAGGKHGANPVAGVILAPGVDDDKQSPPPQRGGCTGACGVTASGGNSSNDGVGFQTTT